MFEGKLSVKKLHVEGETLKVDMAFTGKKALVFDRVIGAYGCGFSDESDG